MLGMMLVAIVVVVRGLVVLLVEVVVVEGVTASCALFVVAVLVTARWLGGLVCGGVRDGGVARQRREIARCSTGAVLYEGFDVPA